MSILEGDPHTIQKALDEHARHVYVILEPTTEDYQLARSLLLTDPGLGLRAPTPSTSRSPPATRNPCTP